jgi:hypothetical protein
MTPPYHEFLSSWTPPPLHHYYYPQPLTVPDLDLVPLLLHFLIDILPTSSMATAD